MPKQRTEWGEHSRSHHHHHHHDQCDEPKAAQPIEDYYKMVSAMYAPYTESLKQMYAGWTGAPQVEMAYPHAGHHPHHHHEWREHECGCDCDRCQDCDEGCTCCIGNADLVVYARLGERRVVPVTIENSSRREREIRLELSNFSRRGGRASGVGVQASLSTEGFTLRGCDEQTVAVVIETNLDQGGADVAGTTEGRTRLDIDECVVLYADLRVEGCDVRPVRIALALMPRDCEAYEVSCDCSCC